MIGVDDNLDAVPMFLWRQPELINAMMRPVNMFNSDDLIRPPNAPYPMNVSWPGFQPVSGTSNNYSVHYLGQYPIAEMQCWDHHPSRPWHPRPTPAQKQNKFYCEPMPLEASADNLIFTTLAAASQGNNTSVAAIYWSTLRTIAEYVAQNGRDPVLQLYTDDYLGPSARNANLAAKAIISLAAYARLCAMMPPALCSDSESKHFDGLARGYASYWLNRTKGGMGGATKRTYDSRVGTTFSAKTNLLFDRLLQTRLFPASVIEKECRTYRQTARRYGWLLDERGLQSNKTNIETELNVALCADSDRADYYARVVNYLAHAPSGWAFADTYDVVTGARLGGEGRSQVGGVFASMALAAERDSSLHVYE